MVERNLGIAIGLMVVRQIILILDIWGTVVFPSSAQPAFAVDVIDPISMVILIPLVAVGGRRTLMGSVVVNIIWFVVGLFAAVQVLVGTLNPMILFIAGSYTFEHYLISAILSIIIAVLTYGVYRSRGKQPVTS